MELRQFSVDGLAEFRDLLLIAHINGNGNRSTAPPISIGTTLIFDVGICNNSATWARTVNEPCVLHQMVTVPSALHRAVALCGSM